MTSPEQNGVVLAARDLVKNYETGKTTVRALDGVTIDVPRGRFMSIMGPSGSGKSTLLHLLGGLDAPSSGDVFLDGTPLSSLPDKELTLARRHRIGFVFQSFNLVPVLDVAENISLPAVIDGKKPKDYRERLDRVLDLVGLTDWRDHLPNEISGGQQQRVAIARALMLGAPLVLADEPTGNLDTHSANGVFELMRRFNRESGTAFLIVTHDPRIAERCDRVFELVDGRLTQG